MTTDIVQIQKEVTERLATKEVMQTLVSTTFKGLDENNVKLAIVEGMIRGFTFEDFLNKNIYAIPYGVKYSLVTSIDYARKLAQRSGIIGKTEPLYEMDNKKIVACSVTIKKKIGNDIGDFTSKVYFDEYTTGKNLWTSKPRTMIAKVAEMHALRMACPEEMSQVYVSEEMEKVEDKPAKKFGKPEAVKLDPIQIDEYGRKLEACKTLEELSTAWSNLPGEAKIALEDLKGTLKLSLK